MERTRRETRIQRAALVCKPHLSSSAFLHFPAFPNAPVWSFTISLLPPLPGWHYPPWIPTSCFIFCGTGNGNHFLTIRKRGGNRDAQFVTPAAGSWDCREEGRRRVLLLGVDVDKIRGLFCDTHTWGNSTFKETLGWWNMEGAGVTGNKGFKFCCAVIWRVSWERIPKDAAFLKNV